jgi:FHS family L-fucose permease-like MFS transporter
VADDHNSTAFAMIIPVVFFVMAYSYALAVNFVPSYRDQVDKVGEAGLRPPQIAEKGYDINTSEKEV